MIASQHLLKADDGIDHLNANREIPINNSLNLETEESDSMTSKSSNVDMNTIDEQKFPMNVVNDDDYFPSSSGKGSGNVHNSQSQRTPESDHEEALSSLLLLARSDSHHSNGYFSPNQEDEILNNSAMETITEDTYQEYNKNESNSHLVTPKSNRIISNQTPKQTENPEPISIHYQSIGQTEAKEQNNKVGLVHSTPEVSISQPPTQPLKQEQQIAPKTTTLSQPIPTKQIEGKESKSNTLMYNQANIVLASSNPKDIAMNVPSKNPTTYIKQPTYTQQQHQTALHQRPPNPSNLNNSNNANNSSNNNSNSTINNITIEDLRRYFHMPIADVAKQFGTCTTALKKICRRLNISKWPYRQILSLTKSIQSLEMAAMNDHLEEDTKQQYRQQINIFRKAIEEVVSNPSKNTQSNGLELTTENINSTNKIPIPSAQNNGSANDAMVIEQGEKTSPSTSIESKPTDIKDITTTTNTATTTNENNNNTISTTTPPSTSSNPITTVNNTTTNIITSNISDDEVETRKVSPEVEQVILAATALITKSSNQTDQKKRLVQKRKLSELNTIQTNNEILPANGFRKRPPDDIDPNNHNTSNITNEISNKSSPRYNHAFMDIGKTVVMYNPYYDNNKLQFCGPVQLAPLHRRKMRPNSARKVVPLMEPDIGSNFHIEFVPQFILSLLHRSMLGNTVIQNTSNNSNGTSNVSNQSTQPSHESAPLPQHHNHHHQPQQLQPPPPQQTSHFNGNNVVNNYHPRSTSNTTRINSNNNNLHSQIQTQHHPPANQQQQQQQPPLKSQVGLDIHTGFYQMQSDGQSNNYETSQNTLSAQPSSSTAAAAAAAGTSLVQKNHQHHHQTVLSNISQLPPQQQAIIEAQANGSMKVNALKASLAGISTVSSGNTNHTTSHSNSIGNGINNTNSSSSSSSGTSSNIHGVSINHGYSTSDHYLMQPSYHSDSRHITNTSTTTATSNTSNTIIHGNSNMSSLDVKMTEDNTTPGFYYDQYHSTLDHENHFDFTEQDQSVLSSSSISSTYTSSKTSSP